MKTHNLVNAWRLWPLSLIDTPKTHISLENLTTTRRVLGIGSPEQCAHGFLDSHEDGCFERANGTATANCQRDGGHGDVVGRLPNAVSVV